MNYPDLSNILIDTSYPQTTRPSAPPLVTPSTSLLNMQTTNNTTSSSITPSAPPPITIPINNSHNQLPSDSVNTNENQLYSKSSTPVLKKNNRDDYKNLYNSILKQISQSLLNKHCIVSEWSNNQEQYESYIWFKQIFLGKISIVFTNDNSNYILPHTANVSISINHMSNTCGWDIIESNKKYIYHKAFNLNENYVLHYLCKQIFKIIMPIYLLPKKKMTFWNLLDGSYFVKTH